jgi:hypothetical protein
MLQGENMITKVWIDYETQELVVESGQCCEQRFALLVSNPMSYILPDPGDDGGVDFPEGTEEPTACTKADAIMSVVFDLVDRVFDALPDSQRPDQFIRAVHSAYPNIKFGDISLLSLYAGAMSVSAAGLESETEDPDIQQEMLCQVAGLFDDGPDGITADQEESVDNVITSVAYKHFNIASYPLTWQAMAECYYHAYRAIGPSDARNLTKYLLPGDEDCSCPSQEVVYDWTQTFDFTVSQYNYHDDGVGSTWVSGTGWVGSDNYDADGSRVKVTHSAAESDTMWDGAIGVIKRMEITLTNTVGFDVGAGYEYAYCNNLGIGGGSNEWEFGASLNHDGTQQTVGVDLDLAYSTGAPQQCYRLLMDIYHAHILEGASHISIQQVVIKGFGVNPYVANGTP